LSRVLITGGAGFIGRHLIAHLLASTDWRLTVLDRLGEGSDLTALQQDERVRYVWHDLRASHMRESIGVDYTHVIHLAAASHVDRSVRVPLDFVADNVTGTSHLLEFARLCGSLEKLLHFSTDEVFGAAPPGKAFDEYDSLAPTNPYAASKAAAETLCSAWASTYGLPIVVTRCTNVAGAGQNGEKFIPNTIGKIRRGEVVQIHARDGVASSRKYIDVADVCAAVVTVLERGGIISGRRTGYYNIGSDHEYSNVDIATCLADLLETSITYELVTDPPNRPRPDMRYDVKTDRLKALGWMQRVPILTTLDRCVKGTR